MVHIDNEAAKRCIKSPPTLTEPSATQGTMWTSATGSRSPDLWSERWPHASQLGEERMGRWYFESSTRQWLHGNVAAWKQDSAVQSQTPENSESFSATGTRCSEQMTDTTRKVLPLGEGNVFTDAVTSPTQFSRGKLECLSEGIMSWNIRKSQILTPVLLPTWVCPLSQTPFYASVKWWLKKKLLLCRVAWKIHIHLFSQ